MARYSLSFTSEQNVCGISLKEPIDEFRVVLESVDKKLLKRDAFDNMLKTTIIYSAIVAVVYIAAIIMYIVMCSYYLLDYWAGFAVFYVYSLIGLAFPAATIGGYFLVEILSRRGGF